MTDTSLPMADFVSRYVGIPIAPAMEKQISWRFVRLRATFVLTFVKSFGTGTNGIKTPPSMQRTPERYPA